MLLSIGAYSLLSRFSSAVHISVETLTAGMTMDRLVLPDTFQEAHTRLDDWVLYEKVLWREADNLSTP